jgi:hypothetical protein
MISPEIHLAQSWGRLRCERAQLCFYNAELHGSERLLRHAMREAGVPVLEINGLTGDTQSKWIEAAHNVSQEFLMPVLVFGTMADLSHRSNLVMGEFINDAGWLAARQNELTSAIECSDLHQEFRRSHDKTGWLRIGWHDPAELLEGNGLLLAWTSPLPLLRLRNFSARCPKGMKVIGPDADHLATDLAQQGISVSHWQIEVK